MKKYLFVLALSSLSILTVSAQDNSKARKDVTYSTHNYKHPNKAAAARQWESKKSVAVNAPVLSPRPIASYKHSVPGAVPAGGVVVPHTPEMDVAVRNYKIQRISESRRVIESAQEVANKIQNQSGTDGN